MAIVQCPQGHFYDNEKYMECPGCGSSLGRQGYMEEQITVSLEALEAAPEAVNFRLHEEKRSGVHGQWDGQKTVSLSTSQASALFAGWLVCVTGPMRGIDFKLYPGFNRIGRDLSSDICLQDPLVSRSNHCSVVYDGKNRLFYLVPGLGTITYLDGESAGSAVPLDEGARIGLGSSELILVPFCKGDRVWG